MATQKRRVGNRAATNLYAFIRLRLGTDVSDREIARRWKMAWKSFTLLKQGERLVPRVHELDSLSKMLGVDPACVWEVARGTPARKVHRLIQKGDQQGLFSLLMPLVASG